MIRIKWTGNCSSLCNSDRMFPMGMFRFWILCLFMPLLVGLGAAEPQGAAGSARWGHSAHGSAFDSGPRQKPWAMEGIGKAPFPITTRDPEVQKWFDQGNAMLHSFFFYEAERAFRWCVKLEPDNAMAYWGLARATEDRRTKEGERAVDFLREAVKRKAQVSERERLYIEAWEAVLLPDPLAEKDKDPLREQVKKLETLVLKYPDDIEAKCLLGMLALGHDRYAADLVLREVLARQPDHPGAHHYRIHNWDYHEPQQALDSCKAYTDGVPGIGHAQHMPGHIYSILGMWNEAALSMDAATRVEKRYMMESLTFPFNNWNYSHNRTYLSYIQEQLGMVEAAISGARQLMDAPLDPNQNNEKAFGSHSRGIAALARALLKFERWDELLNTNVVTWGTNAVDQADKAYFHARAWFAKGDRAQAEKRLKDHSDAKPKEKKGSQWVYEIQSLDLKARLALSRGETLRGLGLLADAAQQEYEHQQEYADPPGFPEVLYNSLGQEYLAARSPVLAAQAFEKALQLTRNDLFALSGLVRAYAAVGENAKAKDAMARLLYVTSQADPGLKVLERARETGITAEPTDASPAPQRNYALVSLDKYGPSQWEPYAAPELNAVDSEGKAVSLKDYRGRNVILVFYLGTECAHCMKQLSDLAAKQEDWERLDTVVLAVSSKVLQKDADEVKGFKEIPVLLADQDHVSARKFHSFDDFEEIELHSTSLIDKEGRVYWGRYGGDPFTDTAFLLKQLEKMNARLTRVQVADTTPSPPN